MPAELEAGSTASPPQGAAQPPELTLPEALRRWGQATLDLSAVALASVSGAGLLFILTLGIYLVTRLVRLEDFPIYFFADEAVQALFAENLVKAGFRDANGLWFPVYVEAAASRWTPLLPMYFHALALSLFGKSIFITRATAAVVSLLAAVSSALSLKYVFKARYWWIGALVLTVTPAWFLHSRTAFETVFTTTFYACFLLFYLLYRTRSPHFLYPALVFAAAAFYTYSNGQLVVAAAGALLFISDLPYHWQQRKTVLIGLGLAVVLALPLLLFRYYHPDALGEHLRAVNSYWFFEIPLGEKLWIFLQKAAYGLSPQYWFFPHGHDLPRHRWDSLGHMRLELLPVFLMGVALCLWKVRSAPHRALLLAALATPAGAALVEVGITRVLAFVVPASILAGLGLDWALQYLENFFTQRSDAKLAGGSDQRPVVTGRWYRLLASLTFAAFAIAAFGMLRGALTQGRLWFSDYGLYGMQYGARQLFEQAIPPILEQEPETRVRVTSTWANGADRFLSFFFTPEQLKRIRIDGVQTYLFKRQAVDEHDLFIMTPAEYDLAVKSPKLKDVRVEQTIPYPDGTTGFLFVRFAYSEQADALFIAEQEARRALVDDVVLLDGEAVTLRHSAIDMGEPGLMFDGDNFTLMRGLEANPFVLEMTFPEPRSLSRVEANYGLAELTMTVLVTSSADPQGEPVGYRVERSNASQDPWMVVDLPGAPLKVTRLRIEIFNRLAGETANIHIRELRLVP